MSRSRRFVAPAVALLSLVLVACGNQSAAPSTPPSAAASPGGSSAASADDPARAAYSTAMCPIFTGILEVDPRLAAMRSAGATGGDMTVHTAEIAAIGDELLALLTGLEAVPEWAAGAQLRYQLITALHGIRAELLHVGRDPAAAGAAADLAELPFIASEAMDRAMEEATDGGLTCESGS